MGRQMHQASRSELTSRKIIGPARAEVAAEFEPADLLSVGQMSATSEITIVPLRFSPRVYDRDADSGLGAGRVPQAAPACSSRKGFNTLTRKYGGAVAPAAMIPSISDTQALAVVFDSVALTPVDDADATIATGPPCSASRRYC